MGINMPAGVRLALQSVYQDGVVVHEGCWSSSTGLRRWQRIINWFCKKIGAPYRDPMNYSVATNNPLSNEDRRDIAAFLQKYTDEPRCGICGGVNLAADPSGYYFDAVDWRGAPLLCQRCRK